MSEKGKLQETPIYQALVKPSLFAGADRELTLTITLMFAAIAGIGVGIQPLAALISLIILAVCIWGLRLAAKADPRMRQKYLRSLRYKAVYKAHSRPYREG